MTNKPHLNRKHFTSAEDLLLRTIPENDVSSEINLVRICLARYFEYCGNSIPSDLKVQASALQVTSAAASMIASLVRTQLKFHSPDTELIREINEALACIRKEMNIE